MRSGVRLGIDVGTARIGIARSDHHGMLALPVDTIRRGSGDLAHIQEIVAKLEVIEIVVGLPLSLSGHETASTKDARVFASEISGAIRVPVRLVDERLSTVSAHSHLRASGRTAKNSRSVVDQVAAVIILQHALDVERSSGSPPGIVTEPPERI